MYRTWWGKEDIFFSKLLECTGNMQRDEHCLHVNLSYVCKHTYIHSSVAAMHLFQILAETSGQF